MHGARRLIGLWLALALPACQHEPAPVTPPAVAPVAASPAEVLLDAGSVPAAPPRAPARTMSWRGADWLTRPERAAQEEPDRMVEALHLRPGDTVADIGAGVGYHAWRLAERVGPSGTVYATDLQPEMLQLLRQAMADRKVQNVVPVQATPDRTGLADGSIDVALLVDVYHEVVDPQGFLQQLRRALKPGGRLVLVEFRAEDPTIPIRAEHRMTAEQAIAELAQGGFRLTERSEILPWQHLLVFVPAR